MPYEEDPPIELVVWDDAWRDHDEGRPENWDDKCRLMSVGFVVRETDTLLSLAQDVYVQQSPAFPPYREVVHIAKAMIVTRERFDRDG